MNAYLAYTSLATGSITTLYGAYSYFRETGNSGKANKRRQKALNIAATGVALLALGAAFLYFGKAPNMQQLKGRVEQIQASDYAEQASISETNKFPCYLSKFPHPEYVATDTGELCLIPDNGKLPELEKCAEELRSEIIRKIRPGVINDIEQKTLTDLTFKQRITWGKGYTIAYREPKPDTFNQFNLAMDKTIVSSYKKSIKLAEEIFLKDSNFPGTRSDLSILASIQKIHRTMMQGVQHPDGSTPVNPGVLRDFPMWIRTGQLDSTDSVLAISQHDVPKAMEAFAKKFGEICSFVKDKSKDLVIPEAAWVHQELGKIHPFGDGNGRMARLLQNVVLQIGGIAGVVFPDDKAYTTAVNEGLKSYTAYLYRLIEWNTAQKALHCSS